MKYNYKANINGKNLINYIPKTSGKNKVQNHYDNSMSLSNINFNGNLNFKTTIVDKNKAREINEMLNNESFSTISFFHDTPELSGKYILKNFNLNLKNNVYFLQMTLEGKHDRIKWLVSSDEFDTDWDTIINLTDGNPSSLPNVINDGHWSDGGDYIVSDGTAGARLIFDYLWRANFSFQADFYTPAGGTGTWLPAFEFREVSTSNKYFAFVSIGTQSLIFRKDSTTLKTMYFNDTDALTTATWYTMKVVAQGNRFDFYFAAQGESLEYVGTVFDDYYQCGQLGFYGASAQAYRIDNIQVKIAKPQAMALPVGAYDWNQIRMPATTRLNDDVSADGLQRTIIAPDNPVTFKQLVPKLTSIPKTEGLWYVNDDSPVNGGYIRDHSGNDRHMVESGTYPRAISTDYPTIHRAMFQKTNKHSYYRWNDTSNGFTTLAGYTVHILMKVRLSQVSVYSYYFKMDDSISGDEICYPYTSSSDTRIRIEPVGEASATHRLSTTSPSEDPWTYNEWHLITFTFDGDKQFKHYVDGVLQSPGHTHSASCVFEEVNRIEGFGWNSPSYGFTVETGMVHVLSRDQGAAEIKEYADTLLFNNPTGGEIKVWDTNNEDGLWDYLELLLKFNENQGSVTYDSSRNNRSISTTGTLAFIDSYNKQAKTAYDCSAGSYLQTSASSDFMNSELSIVYWVKFDDLSADRGMFNVYYDADNRLYLRTRLASSDWHIYCEIAGNIYQTTYSGITPETDKWYMIAITIKNGEWKVYINANEVISTSWADDLSNYAGSPYIRIGDSVGSGDLDGKLDSFVFYSKVLSADRVKWLYENMPNMVIEQEWTNPDTGNTIGGWTRVYDPDHDFKGNMVIDNGLIRLDQYYRRRSVSSPHDSNEPRIIGYTDGNWLDNFEVYGGFHYTSSSSIFTNYLPLVIKELNKHKVVIETKVFDLESDVWITLEIIINKNPFVLYKATDWKLPGNCYTYFGSIRGIRGSATTHGYDQGPRFCINTLDRVHDQEIATGNVSGARTEGLSVAFSKQQNILWLVFFDDSNGDWHSQWGSNTGYPITVVANSVAINFDADSPPHYWAIGMIPFNTSGLHEDITTDDWGQAPAVKAGASTGNAVEVDSVNTSQYWDGTVELPEGSYRCFLRLISDTGDEDTLIRIYELDGITVIGSATHNNLSTSWNWYAVDFILDHDDEVRVRNDFQGGTASYWVDEYVIIPISNSKNFPLDVRDQMLANITINESIGN